MTGPEWAMLIGAVTGVLLALGIYTGIHPRWRKGPLPTVYDYSRVHGKRRKQGRHRK